MGSATVAARSVGLAALVALALVALAPPAALAQESSAAPLGGDRARWYRAEQLYVVPADDEWAVALQGDVRVIVGDALVLADGAVVWFQPGAEKDRDKKEGGGKDAGGDTAVAPGYGYESCNARHDQTYFPEHSEFYMTFLGPLQSIQQDGTPIAVVSWEQAQGAWDAATQQTAAE